MINMLPYDPKCRVPTKQERVLLTPLMILTPHDIDVKDSTFFKKFTQLPSPDEVRSQAKAQDLSGICLDDRETVSMVGPNVRPPPVILEDLGLLIKWRRKGYENFRRAVPLYSRSAP